MAGHAGPTLGNVLVERELRVRFERARRARSTFRDHSRVEPLLRRYLLRKLCVALLARGQNLPTIGSCAPLCLMPTCLSA